MFTLLTILVPTALFLLALYALDSFALVRKARLAVCVGSGVLVCLTLFCLSIPEGIPEWIFPLVEEVLKSALLMWMVFKRRILFLAEALCYGGAAGAGFAMAENGLYLFYNPGMQVLPAIIRGVGTALLHMGCTAIFACLFLVVMSHITGRSGSSPRRRRGSAEVATMYFLAIAPATAIHYIYNLFLLPVFLQMVVTVVFFLAVFVALSVYNERRIYKWMDDSISCDIKLLSAIRKGRLADTPAGKYLGSVREQFQPIVFFDILCYMQVYLELVVMGKSRMLLEQEGLAKPLTEEEKESYDSMRAELKAIRRNIGFTGEQVLRPILRFAPEDRRFTTVHKSHHY